MGFNIAYTWLYSVLGGANNNIAVIKGWCRYDNGRRCYKRSKKAEKGRF